ncbi:hypothetical protein QYS36_19115 [Pseudomonas sp. G34]|uniref:hypothetical protein n=1 Tax=Pseudomonas sp. G34 TaxID=3059083 RepID=UPI0028077CDA|nr:hypothetical protein [Pseudomonas sp. G34]MDQ7987055.1 hypothetical protein [Pseudomonas sp. G34]
MQSFFQKTFGGLNRPYFMRQLFFGALFAVLMLWVAANGTKGIMGNPGMVVMCVVNTLLYPYARFVYESIVGYIMGSNVFFVNALIMLFVKVMTMALCWSMAIFIAPVGLAYLYWANSRNVPQ